MPKHDQPSDLAIHVYNTLKKQRKYQEDLPDEAIVIELFECLFYASMQTEEGQLIQCTATFFNPNELERELCDDDTLDHWEFTAFNEPIRLTVKSLVKLSQAADPWSSSLAVYCDEQDNLMIYGLIDQAIHNQSFINHEIDTRPEPVGFFQIAIQGIGILSVTSGYRLLGILRQNTVVTHFLDVWKFGQISLLLKDKAKTFLDNIESFLSKNFDDQEISDYEDLIYNVWRDTLSRILIQIRKYHHGGAILITDFIDELDVKYPMVYKRLRSSMLRFVKTSIAFDIANAKISRSRVPISKSDFQQIRTFEFKKREANNELKGAIRYIAAQSCVDGLIIFNSNLHSFGFGAIINEVSPPPTIYLSNTSTFKIPDLLKKDPKEFGTRHRSMMTYCYNNPGSIGIVISQDGEIRVMAEFNNRLVMWENVKTQKYLRAPV